MEILPLVSEDIDWLRPAVQQYCGGEPVVTPGGVFWLEGLPGFKAVQANQPIGLITYHIASIACEIVTLASFSSGMGTGSALVAAVRAKAKEAGCYRLWVSTTNDNLNALRFYQKRGFHLVAVHRNAMEQVRQIKPRVPFIGTDGIPLRDVLELEQEIAAEKASN